jgi:hypothetical protein
MAEQRRVYLRGNSWVVPVPRPVRDHLRILHGGHLYWHVGPKGEAMVTVGPRRIGGKPPGLSLERDLDAARKEIERLRRKAQARPQALLQEDAYAVAQKVAGLLMTQLVKLDSIDALLKDVHTRLPYRRLAPRPRRVVTAGDVSKVGAVEESPSPSGPPPAEGLPGGADTSEAKPPGVPLES